MLSHFQAGEQMAELQRVDASITILFGYATNSRNIRRLVSKLRITRIIFTPPICYFCGIALNARTLHPLIFVSKSMAINVTYFYTTELKAHSGFYFLSGFTLIKFTNNDTMGSFSCEIYHITTKWSRTSQASSTPLCRVWTHPFR